MARLSSVLLAVTLLLGCVSCLNFVKDPSFEKDCPLSGAAAATLWSNNLFAVVSQDFYLFPAHSGRCLADFYDSANPGVAVSQTINFVTGATYQATAYIRAIDALGGSVTFNVYSNPTSLAIGQAQGYVPFVVTFTGNGAAAFSYTNTGNVVIDDIEIKCISGACPGIVGDPHVRGFSGEVFDITGKSQSVFNVISDADVQVNGRLGSVHLNNLVLGNYIKEMGFLIRNHTILALAGGDSIPETAMLIVDGQKVSAPYKATIDDVITIEFVRVSGKASDHGLQSSDNLNSIIRISYNYEYDFEIFNVENGISNGAWVTNPRRFINFQSSIHHDRDPEGVFGRTHRPENKRSNFAMSDYELASADIFGKDFELNRFKSL